MKKAAGGVGGLIVVMAACSQIGGIQAGIPRECAKVDDCRPEVPECSVPVDCNEGRCVFTHAPDGTPLETQTEGDCIELGCDGAGKTKALDTPMDVADDGDPCTHDECRDGQPVHTRMTELPCYTGPWWTRGQGVCADGIQHCDAEGRPIGLCEGQMLPNKEDCDFLEQDEDCDNLINESGNSCVCTPGEIIDCYTGTSETLGVGICHAGNRRCNTDGLGYGPCIAEQTPLVESCDAAIADEDCDGEVNEQSADYVCGDGYVSPGEGCDDANTNDGDDCPSTCRLPMAWIMGGAYHTCAPVGYGRIKCWGANFDGQLGLGNTAHRGDDFDEMGCHLPVTNLGTGKTVKALATGHSHTCAILNDNSVKCWGYNAHGELGLGDTARRGDDFDEMGDALPAANLGTGKTAKAIIAGYWHTCAILNDSSVKCWGRGVRLGLGDTNHRGDEPNEMGDNLPSVDLGTGKTAKALTAGRDYTCAILNDNSVKCWGENPWGALGLGDTDPRGDNPNEMGDNLPAVDLGTGHTVKTITAGGVHTCATLNDDNLKCWGGNLYGTLGLGETNHRGDDPNEMGDNLPAVNLGTGYTAETMAGGASHTCAIVNDGSLKCWGANFSGELGLGLGDTGSRGDNPNEMGDALPAIDLGANETAKGISGGVWRTCAVLNNDTVKCWGSNEKGQLGLGPTPGGAPSDLPTVSLW